MSSRLGYLAAAGYNTNLLSPAAIEIDLLSDSWRERVPPASPAASITGVSLEARLGELYGYPYNLPVSRGRFAEALLAQILIQPGRSVVCNALFPTTHYHLAARGAPLLELGVAAARAPRDPHPFKGDLDLDALRAALAGGQVQAIYLELCANSLGGHPISLANLRAVGRLATDAGIPMLLDATRAWENAALIRDREPGQHDRALGDIVREICDGSAACAASLSKDFITPVGAFIGARSQETYVQLRDLAHLAYGQELSAAEVAALGQALAVDPEQPGGAEDRAGIARRLHQALRAAGVPVFDPAGGHGVFVDAQAFLPDLPPEAHPTASLCNALYLAGGLRAGANLASPAADNDGAKEVLRLALPQGQTEAEGAVVVAAIAATFERVAAARGAIRGLTVLRRPPGMVGAFACVYQPI